MRITVVVNDTAIRPGLKEEHGLSMFIETPGSTVLLDTGQGGALLHNARQLGVAVRSASAIVLSHGHYDHADGLPLLRECRRSAVFAHPGVIVRRYSCVVGGGSHAVGISADAAAVLRELPVVWTSAPVAVSPGVLATGPIPRGCSMEPLNPRLCLDATCTTADPLVDDQALLLDTPRGLVVVLGCGHAGVVNTVRYAMQTTGARRVHGIVGGMHLGHARPERLDYTIRFLDDCGVRLVAPLHCTGAGATRALREAMPGAFVEAGAGSVIDLG